MENELHKIAEFAKRLIGRGDLKKHGITSRSKAPRSLGQYEIERELGEGAMGIVYLGKEVESGQLAAIKTLALSDEFNPGDLDDFTRRFMREAEIVHRLEHPNIIKTYGYGHENGYSYILFEMLYGGDLASCKRRECLLPAAEVLRIVGLVALALDYAHQRAVVHRDVKPDNIMYDRDQGGVKLVDFGVSRIVDESITATGKVFGSPMYMSPEQIKGMKIDGASDIYSLGVTLFELLCGKLPFEADSLFELMTKIVNEPHPDIRKYNPDISDGICEVIDLALTKDASKRIRSGHEMCEMIMAAARSDMQA